MKWNNFTAERISAYRCKPNAKQSFFWDGKTPGLGLRVTASGSKSYVFQAELHSKTIRITIGDQRVWSISKAQTEAARLKVMIDQGVDPRLIEIEKKSAKEATELNRKAQVIRETLTVREVWEKYLHARKRFWGDRHYDDHVEMVKNGGEKRARSSKLTEPGSLASLANIPLVELTADRVQEWALKEGATRPGRARLANRLLKAFISWCDEQPEYREFQLMNVTNTKSTRENLGKPQPIDEVLQREQLLAWFSAVKQIQNPIVAAYLQSLLLTGSRPNEVIALKWENLDFMWKTLTIKDKVDGFRIIPLTPYTEHLLAALPRRNEWVFSSLTSSCGHLIDAGDAHKKACIVAGLDLTLYSLRRSFATLCEWIEMPSGIAAQIQGHKPSGVREKHYIRRPIDLLRVWHVRIEEWILEQACFEFVPVKAGMHIVTS